MSEYILSLSYGKDSLACLGAIEKLGLPLDRIVHVEVWATNTIPGDLPPMIEFKHKADQIILQRYGIMVEHIRAKASYEDYFYSVCGSSNKHCSSNRCGQIYGFPFRMGQWCTSRLKTSCLNSIKGIHYVGIAFDEPERFHVLSDTILSPLVQAGWTESKCFSWVREHNLLSPIYLSASRGGCWFCHNQSVSQLRLLRRNYPDYWRILLDWDHDSPVSFKPNGLSVSDFEARFIMEDNGLIPSDSSFRWSMLADPPLRQFSLFDEVAFL